MDFDAQLRRVFDRAIAELTDAAVAEREHVRQEALEEGRADGHRQGREQGRQEGHEEGRQAGREEGLQQGREEGREEGRAEGRRAAEHEARTAFDAAAAAASDGAAASLAAAERLLDGIRSLDRARSLSEILDTLAACAGREASRAAVLVVRGDRLRSWCFIGFDPAPDGSGPLDIALDEAGVLADAVRTRARATGETGSHPGPPPFAAVPEGHECLATPVVLADEIVAVLYADQTNRTAEAGASSVPAWPEMLEVLARHAARCLEAVTAIKTARALTDLAGARPPSPAARDEEDAEVSARRYAKLLVSEIKLYHEAAVLAGRRERDLGTRLGGEIARARVMYEQRVPEAVRRRSDYFHEELVRTLANGDASLLQLT